ncbi:OmpA family protein [candidate division KSB1 bacterium]|nr:MAG: OmpA family protein [candidate division KSB1 bacterium]
MFVFRILVFSICALFLNSVQAQYRDAGFEVGILGGVAYDNSTDVDDAQPGLQGRLLIAGPLLPFAQWEIGGGYTELRSRDAHSVLTPADMILKLSPGGLPGFIPYIFGGGGILYYRYDKFPGNTAPGTDRNGWVPYVPVGAGAQLRVSPGTQLEVRGSYNQMFSPDVSPASTRADDDSYFGVLAGLRFRAGGGNPDIDGDGLPNRLEKSIGTDPRNADSDADSLSDDKEYNTYKTNPLNRDTDDDGLGDGAEAQVHGTDALKPDTDGDGLSDFEELVQYKTSPTKTDSDDDGLSDGREISESKTDPKKPDSDGDGLSDGDEVNKYKTDPKKMDTDGGTVADGLEVERRSNPLDASDDVKKVAEDSDRDGLTDADEINKYHTNPKKMDTDGGTIADGLEVERGTNPLDPKDDLPPTPAPQIMVFELDKPVVLPGIQFEFNKAIIKPESESILIQAYNSLNEHQEIEVEISGHADAIGSDEYNRVLSARRAESVRQWMINKGIAATRLTSIGYGESRPVASNDTEEGRALNRRIEFKRTK